MLNTRRHDRGGLVVVHDDGGNDQECHVGVGASVGFPAGELAVMPGGMSQNRNVDRENGTRAGIGRSSQVCCTSNRKILGEFRLGAGLRYRDPPDSSVSNPTRILSALRSPSGVARWKVLGALALQELIALARPAMASGLFSAAFLALGCGSIALTGTPRPPSLRGSLTSWVAVTSLWPRWQEPAFTIFEKAPAAARMPTTKAAWLTRRQRAGTLE